MEAKKTEKKQEKLTYEQLQHVAGELSQQNQRLMQQVRQMNEALDRRDFDYSSFFLSMLFKVMDHPEMYDEQFVEWAKDSIQEALSAFSKAITPQEENDGEKDEKAE